MDLPLTDDKRLWAVLIERYWYQLDVESLRAYRKYRYRLPDLSIKADFCLALDTFLRAGGDFERLFSRELRLDLEGITPIKAHLKKVVGRTFLARAFPSDPNVSCTRLIYDLDHINTYTKATEAWPVVGDGEAELTKRETEDYIVDEFGREVYEDWLSHYVYGETLRRLAVLRGVSHEAIRGRVNRVRSRIWKRARLN